MSAARRKEHWSRFGGGDVLVQAERVGWVVTAFQLG
jgi:hypothetical protein